MIGLIGIIVLALFPSIWLFEQVIKNYNLSEENKKLKKEIKNLRNLKRIPKDWFINELDNIIKDIEFEISKRPNHANIGKYGCLKLITTLRNKI